MNRSAPKNKLKKAALGWVEALNAFGAAEVVAGVLAPRGVVWRHVADEPDTKPQRLAGRGAIGRWLATSPGAVRFSLVEGSLEPLADDPLRGRVRYRVEVDEFENFGIWEIRLAVSGLIQELKHYPDPVPARWRVGSEV